MIKAFLIFNTQGKVRLCRFYEQQDVAAQQEVIAELFSLVSRRSSAVCNFLEGSARLGGAETRVIYRNYATLYFVAMVDTSESELGILDLIQVFVESLDREFENVCELDLIFHFDRVHHLLSEMISGGLVLETNINEICGANGAANEAANGGSGRFAEVFGSGSLPMGLR